jgi:hypothetical protein
MAAAERKTCAAAPRRKKTLCISDFLALAKTSVTACKYQGNIETGRPIWEPFTPRQIREAMVRASQPPSLGGGGRYRR